MRAVPARLVARGNQNVAAPLHALDLPLHQPKLRRVDEDVRRVDGDERSFDRFQFGRGVVLTRGVELVEHIVGVGVRQLRFQPLRVKPVRRLARRRSLLPLQGAAAHEQEYVERRSQPLLRLVLVLSTHPRRVVAYRVEELPRPEEHARELRREELCARAARPVHDEDGIADDASLVARGSPNRRVVQFQFRQALAASEMKVADDEITLDGRRIVGPRRSLSRADAGLRQDGLTGGTQQQQQEKNSSDVHSHPLSEQTCFRRTGAFPFFSRRGEKPATYLRGGETKTAFGIIACTPLLPSTSCVICKSAATLESMYASSRVRRFSVTRKSIISRRGPSL